MNWGDLKAQIQDYMETTFSIDSLTTFTQQAEQRIFNTIQFPSLRANKTSTCTANNPYLSCPSDFLSTYSLSVIDTDGA